MSLGVLRRKVRMECDVITVSHTNMHELERSCNGDLGPSSLIPPGDIDIRIREGHTDGTVRRHGKHQQRRDAMELLSDQRNHCFAQLASIFPTDCFTIHQAMHVTFANISVATTRHAHHLEVAL